MNGWTVDADVATMATGLSAVIAASVWLTGRWREWRRNVAERKADRIPHRPRAALSGSAGLAYGVLLFANGAGGVLGGVLLEATGRIKPTVTAAVVSTAVYGVTTLFFALTSSYPVAVVLLVAGGIAYLASMSITQTVVQLLAPPEERGRVIGLYGVSANACGPAAGSPSACWAPPLACTSRSA